MTTQTATLSDFLLARLADRAAEVDTIPDWYCTESARGEGWGSRGDCPMCGKYMFDGTESVTKEAFWEHMEDAHQRTQVLREVEALRAAVELHESKPADVNTRAPAGMSACVTCGDGEWYAVAYPCPTLRALAQVWASHPEFDPAWEVGA